MKEKSKMTSGKSMKKTCILKSNLILIGIEAILKRIYSSYISLLFNKTHSN